MELLLKAIHFTFNLATVLQQLVMCFVLLKVVEREQQLYIMIIVLYHGPMHSVIAVPTNGVQGVMGQVYHCSEYSVA